MTADAQTIRALEQELERERELAKLWKRRSRIHESRWKALAIEVDELRMVVAIHAPEAIA